MPQKHDAIGGSESLRREAAAAQTANGASLARVAIVMVVSPGEAEIALDSLSRAALLSPGDTTFFLADNTGDLTTIAAFPSQLARPLVILPVQGAPRPYFEIGRTVFSLLSRVAPFAPELVIKIDPDTVVLSPLFFIDLMELVRQADFAAAQITCQGFGNNFRRLFRLMLDVLPIGITRTEANTRYGAISRLRLGRAWHWRGTLTALIRWRAPRAYPSGGAYGLSGRMLARLGASGRLVTSGSDGLEWNDDILLPLLIRALGGKIVDVRSTAAANGWRWMHGSRYFEAEDLHQPGVRAAHPLKNTPSDLTIRQLLPHPTK